MRIGRGMNLTVAHLRHRLFGPGRLDRVPARSNAAPLPLRLRLTQTQAVQSPHRVLASQLRRPAWLASAALRPQPWPYDTAFPTGLHQPLLFPGQHLTDMPSTGALLAQAKRPDNPPAGHSLASALGGVADHRGKLIDVLA